MNTFKKFVSVLLCAVMVFSFVGCAADKGDTGLADMTDIVSNESGEISSTEGTTASSDSTTRLQDTYEESTVANTNPSQTTEKNTTEKNTTEKQTTERQPTEERTTVKETTEKNEDKPTVSNPNKKSLRILSVGNSLSRDGMHYLPQMLKEAGYTDIVIAYLYVGSCSLEEHVENARANRKAYDYFENNGSGWNCREGVSLKYGLAAQKWDYVVLQQASRLSGVSSSYKYLDELIAIVRSNTQNNPQLLWHMTWAYEDGSDLELFEKYDYDRNKMHRQIVACIKEHVLTNRSIKGVIPVGSAVENYRKSSPGSRITEDGRHMTRPLGRYLAGLVWFGFLTKSDIASVKFNPDEKKLNAKTVSQIKKSVKTALENPVR